VLAGQEDIGTKVLMFPQQQWRGLSLYGYAKSDVCYRTVDQQSASHGHCTIVLYIYQAT